MRSQLCSYYIEQKFGHIGRRPPPFIKSVRLLSNKPTDNNSEEKWESKEHRPAKLIVSALVISPFAIFISSWPLVMIIISIFAVPLSMMALFGQGVGDVFDFITSFVKDKSEDVFDRIKYEWNKFNNTSSYENDDKPDENGNIRPALEKPKRSSKAVDSKINVKYKECKEK